MNYSEFAAFYDRLQEADYDEIGGYFHKLLNGRGAGSGILLDLACGTGALSRYFADLNYDVIGTDISPEMLSIAAKKPHERIQYLCQDMTELDLFGTIDCCICVLDGFNHLPGREAVKRAFSRISLFMNRGGVFVFDMNTLYKHEKLLSGNTFVYDLKDLYCVWQNSDCTDGRVDMTLDVFARGLNSGDVWQRHAETLSETAYPLEIITEMLTGAGFGDIRIYDWLSDEPVNELSEKAVFSAIKL
ncbi:MAG: methyltransferase domain-containing protein [Oscillospiraceae bacterium]|nr:methyltransferase domain-containing protein [Oscillospiraceae bacterium]